MDKVQDSSSPNKNQSPSFNAAQLTEETPENHEDQSSKPTVQLWQNPNRRTDDNEDSADDNGPDNSHGGTKSKFKRTTRNITNVSRLFRGRQQLLDEATDRSNNHSKQGSEHRGLVARLSPRSNEKLYPDHIHRHNQKYANFSLV